MSLISKFCQLVDGPQVFLKYSSRAPKVIPPLLTEVLPWQSQREKEIDCWLNNFVTSFFKILASLQENVHMIFIAVPQYVSHTM